MTNPYLIVGLDGVLEMTDGQTIEEVIFPMNGAGAERARWVTQPVLASGGRELDSEPCWNLPAFDPRGARSGPPEKRSAVPRRVAVEEGDCR